MDKVLFFIFNFFSCLTKKENIKLGLLNIYIEIANLMEIKDHFPKMVIALDDYASGNVNGIKIVHLADFLLED